MYFSLQILWFNFEITLSDECIYIIPWLINVSYIPVYVLLKFVIDLLRLSKITWNRFLFIWNLPKCFPEKTFLRPDQTIAVLRINDAHFRWVNFQYCFTILPYFVLLLKQFSLKNMVLITSKLHYSVSSKQIKPKKEVEITLHYQIKPNFTNL